MANYADKTRDLNKHIDRLRLAVDTMEAAAASYADARDIANAEVAAIPDLVAALNMQPLTDTVSAASARIAAATAKVGAA